MGRVTRRWNRAPRIAAVALLLPVTGCCTGLLWKQAPRVPRERVIGTRVDEQGAMELGVELNDGRKLTHHETSVKGESMVFVWMAPESNTDTATIAWPCTPDESGRIALHPAPRFVAEMAE